MKIKVFYDGNPVNTKVIDQETGEMLDGIVSAHVDIDAFEARATIIFSDFEAELTNVEVTDEDPEGLYGRGSGRDHSEDIEQTSNQV